VTNRLAPKSFVSVRICARRRKIFPAFDPRAVHLDRGKKTPHYFPESTSAAQMPSTEIAVADVVVAAARLRVQWMAVFCAIVFVALAIGGHAYWTWRRHNPRGTNDGRLCGKCRIPSLPPGQPLVVTDTGPTTAGVKFGQRSGPAGGDRRPTALAEIGNYSVAHDIGRRPTQEDRHCVWDEVAHLAGAVDPRQWQIFALYDGHGGSIAVDCVASPGADGLVARLHGALVALANQAVAESAAATATAVFATERWGDRVRQRIRLEFGRQDTRLYAENARVGSIGGTTAIVWVLHGASGRVWTAHVGDSRALLIARDAEDPIEPAAATFAAVTAADDKESKDVPDVATQVVAASPATSLPTMAPPPPPPSPLPLQRRLVFETRDHSPKDEREVARVVSAGGIVVDIYGTRRVDGILAMTRALGDFDGGLKRNKRRPELPVDSVDGAVSAMPDVTELRLRRGVRYTGLAACDGVWDVLSSEQVARDYPERAAFACRSAGSFEASNEAGGESKRQSAVGATIGVAADAVDVGSFIPTTAAAAARGTETGAAALVKRALALGSRDNVSALSFDFVLQ
jgi:serine/threonine protein phosphatase PrpC